MTLLLLLLSSHLLLLQWHYYYLHLGQCLLMGASNVSFRSCECDSFQPDLPTQKDCIYVTCATNMHIQGCPKRLLQHCQMPCRPWSHLAIYFSTSLPKTTGFITNLLIINWYLKGLHFNAQTAHYQHIAQATLIINRVTVDCVWQELAFCNSTVILLIGGHPKANRCLERPIQYVSTMLMCFTESYMLHLLALGMSPLKVQFGCPP